MTKQEEAARDLESASAELEEWIGECSDSQWSSVRTSEGWTASALAYHCALGNDVALGWICGMLDGRPVRETGETHNAANAADAGRYAQASRQAALEELRRTSARTASFLRTLTDEELQRGALHGIAGREMSVGAFIPNFGRHVRAHCGSLRLALAAS